MKKFFNILLKGCLGIIIVVFIYLILVFYPLFFPKEITISDYTDNYNITPNTKHPKFKSLVEEFKRQEHRFEFDICEYKYNNQSFFIGDSPKKIVAIFGNPDEKNERTCYRIVGRPFGICHEKGDNKEMLQFKQEYGDSILSKKNYLTYEYKNLKIRLSFEGSNNKDYGLDNFGIGLSKENLFTYKFGESETLFNVILFRKIPYQLDMTLNQFMELSDLSHSKLRRNHHSFYFFQEECSPYEDRRIYTSINSRAAYDTKGGGHMTWRGDFDPNTTYPIETLSFYLKTLEDHLK